MPPKTKTARQNCFLASGQFTELLNLRVRLVKSLRQKAHACGNIRYNLPCGLGGT
jgi:hypothetical protein